MFTIKHEFFTIVTPEYGAIYNNGEGSEADAATTIV